MTVDESETTAPPDPSSETPPITDAPEDSPEDAPATPEDPPKKRNCGRCGATTPAGRARSARNALKHGSCAFTLILPTESEEGFNLLLARWSQRYNPTDDPITHDFVLKAAQAEWHRIRNQGNFDDFLSTTGGVNAYNWTDKQIKNHDLLLRYKTAAERAFQSQFNQLQQCLKSPNFTPKPDLPSDSPPTPTSESTSEPEPDPEPITRIITKSSTSPTGYIALDEWPPRKGAVYPCPTEPPPNPRPDPPSPPKEGKEDLGTGNR
jgi:hypothetical protein